MNEEFIRKVRIGVIALGYRDFKHWAEENGYNPATVRKLILFLRRGLPVPSHICHMVYNRFVEIARLVDEIGITEMKEVDDGKDN